MQTVTSTTTRMRMRTVLALLGWLAALGCCAGGLLATLLWTRPLTFGTLAPVAVPTLTLQLGLATVGLVLALRQHDHPHPQPHPRGDRRHVGQGDQGLQARLVRRVRQA